jgi:hypothetical protein
MSLGLAESVADPPPRRVGEFPKALTTHLDLPCDLVQIDALYGTLDRPAQFSRDRAHFLLKALVISSAHHKIIAPAGRGVASTEQHPHRIRHRLLARHPAQPGVQMHFAGS